MGQKYINCIKYSDLRAEETIDTQTYDYVPNHILHKTDHRYMLYETMKRND